MSSARRPVLVLIIGGLVLLIAAAVSGRSGFGDLELYHRWVRTGVEHGRWPVLDYSWVYPVGALLPMLLMAPFATMGPALGAWMAGVVAVNTCAIVVLVREGEVGRRAAWWWVGFVLLLGPVAIARLEAFAIPLTIVAAAYVARRPAVAAALITIAGWIKLAPVVLLVPLLFTSARRASSVVLSAVVVTAAVSVPVILAGGSSRLLGFLGAQSSRGLQVESVPATVITVQRWFGLSAAPRYNRALDVWEFPGSLAGRIATVADLLLPVVLVGILVLGIWSVRRRSSDRVQILALIWLALSLSLVVFNKVGSAQYVAWPAGAIVLGLLAGSAGVFWGRMSAAFLVLATLTQCVYPYLYSDLLDERLVATLILLIRNALLVGLLSATIVKLTRVGMDRVTVTVRRGSRTDQAREST